LLIRPGGYGKVSLFDNKTPKDTMTNIHTGNLGNGPRFDRAVEIVTAANATLGATLAKRRAEVLTAIGVVKTAEKETRAGVNFGSASVRKAAIHARIDPATADVLASAWALSVALGKA
jgi:hypothetical protein